MKKRKLPLLHTGLLLILWGLFIGTGEAGFNIMTALVVAGSILYLCIVLREAATH